MPFSILKRLIALDFEERSIAFCFINKNNEIEGIGGELNIYGLENLKVGRSAEDEFSFIEDASHQSTQSRLIRLVAIKPGVFADVYVICDENGVWIVLADATEEVERISLMQQRGNEANLLRERIEQITLQLNTANSTIEKLQAELGRIRDKT